MELLDNKDRIARKEHKCFFCKGTIKKGEVYECQVNKNAGQIYELKVHKHCVDLSRYYDMYKGCDNGGLTEDSFYEDIREAFNDEFSTAEKARMLYYRVFGEE